MSMWNLGVNMCLTPYLWFHEHVEFGREHVFDAVGESRQRHSAEEEDDEDEIGESGREINHFARRSDATNHARVHYHLSNRVGKESSKKKPRCNATAYKKISLIECLSNSLLTHRPCNS